jgi:RHS repeat-associated protein
VSPAGGGAGGQARLRHVYHADALGSIAAITDESGSGAKTYSYEAFWKIRVEGGELLQNRTTYTGREELADSAELRYYRFRVYDPSTGRFLSEDPLRFLTGPNVYLYVLNNPLMFIDPWGLSNEDFDKGGACKQFLGRLFGPIRRFFGQTAMGQRPFVGSSAGAGVGGTAARVAGPGVALIINGNTIYAGVGAGGTRTRAVNALLSDNSTEMSFDALDRYEAHRQEADGFAGLLDD